MQCQYRPPIPHENKPLQQGAEYNAPLKAKGFFARLPHRSRVSPQKSRHHDLQAFAAGLGRFRSQSFVIGTVEKWASLGEVR